MDIGTGDETGAQTRRECSDATRVLEIVPYEDAWYRRRRATPDARRQQFEAVKRWFEHDWTRIEPKLRTSIVEGICVFLSLFDDNPTVKRTFCPPKACYDPVANADGRYGLPLPPFADLIEQGRSAR